MYSEQKQENNTQNIYLIGSIVDRFISTVFAVFKNLDTIVDIILQLKNTYHKKSF